MIYKPVIYNDNLGATLLTTNPMYNRNWYAFSSRHGCEKVARGSLCPYVWPSNCIFTKKVCVTFLEA